MGALRWARKKVGSAVKRIEDPRLLRGRGGLRRRHPPARRGAHGRAAQPARARPVARPSTSAAALTLPGVVDAFAARRPGRPPPAIPVPCSPGHVQADAAVPAGHRHGAVRRRAGGRRRRRDRYVAEDALELIDVEYEPAAGSRRRRRRDPARGAAAAPPTRPTTWWRRTSTTSATSTPRSPRPTGSSTSGWTCSATPGSRWRPAASSPHRRPVTGELTIWTPPSGPHTVRGILAGMLAMPHGRIRVITPDVGGGFGVKADFYAEDLLAPFAPPARPAGKWIEDRNEHFLSASSHSREQNHAVEVAVRTTARSSAAGSDINGLRRLPRTAGDRPVLRSPARSPWRVPGPAGYRVGATAPHQQGAGVALPGCRAPEAVW